jgi:hypothetical protein
MCYNWGVNVATILRMAADAHPDPVVARRIGR